MSGPDPKPAPRIKDGDASKVKLLSDPACRACRRPAANCHHLVPKGAQRGDDVPQNLIPLCGSGSDGCHGALHGSPYFYEIARSPAYVGGGAEVAYERRDSEWVRRRIGQRLRPEELLYVRSKLGEEAAAEYLHRRYYVTVRN